jgi:protein SCO1/2
MKTLSVGLLAFSLALVGCSTSDDHSSHGAPAAVKTVESDSPFKGAWLQTPYLLPNGKFTDTEGNSVNWATDGLPGEVNIVFFGYTYCADGFCQTQTATAAAAVRGLPSEIKSKVRVVFITTDPARDTPEVLRNFLDQYGEDIIGLTGDFDVIQKAGLALGVEIEEPPSPAPAEGYEVGHGTQLIGFGRGGAISQAPVVWLPETPVADIRADIEVLVKGTW